MIHASSKPNLPSPPPASPFHTSVTDNTIRSRCRQKMWFVYIYDEEQKELRRQKAPGSCPNCSGKVEAVDVEIQWRLCFLPMCFKIKRKYFCTLCSKRLELFY